MEAAGEPRPKARLARIGLAALMVVVGLNVWTGSPLLALWVGSRVQGDSSLTMTAVAVVVVVLAATSLTLAWVLSLLGATYDRLAGNTPTVAQHAPWLRSMRGERERYPGVRAHLTALERVLVGMVVVAFVVFEIWFFFFSTSPIDNRSGRGALPTASVQAD
jgi:hypothetical protein